MAKIAMKLYGVPLDVIPLGSVIQSVTKSATMKAVEMIMAIAAVVMAKRTPPRTKQLMVDRNPPSS